MPNPDCIFYKQATQGLWTWRLEVMPHDGTYRPLTHSEPFLPMPEGFLVTNALTFGWEMPKTPLGWASATTMKVTINIGALELYASGTPENDLHSFIQRYGGTVWTLLSNDGSGGLPTKVEFQGMTSYYHGEQFKFDMKTKNNTTNLELISTGKLAMERTLMYDVRTYLAAQMSTMPGHAGYIAGRSTYTSYHNVAAWETLVYDNSTGPGMKFAFARRANSDYAAGDEEHAHFVRSVDFYDTIEFLVAGQFAYLTRGNFGNSSATQYHHCNLITHPSGFSSLQNGGYAYLNHYKQSYDAANTRGALLPKNEEYMLGYVARVSAPLSYYSGLLGDSQSGLQKEYKNVWDMFADETDAGNCVGYTTIEQSDIAGEYHLSVRFNPLWLEEVIEGTHTRPDDSAFLPELAFGLKGHQSSGCVANAVEPLESDITEQRYLSDTASQNVQQFQARMMLTTSPSANFDPKQYGENMLYLALADGADGDISGPGGTKIVVMAGGFNFAKVFYKQMPTGSGGAYAWINGADPIFVRAYHAPTLSLGDVDHTPYELTSYAVAFPITDGTATPNNADAQSMYKWLVLYKEWCLEIQRHGWATLTAQASGMITARGDNEVTDAKVYHGHASNTFATHNNPSSRFQIAPKSFAPLYKPSLPLDSVLIKSETTVPIPGRPMQTVQLWTKSNLL